MTLFLILALIILSVATARSLPRDWRLVDLKFDNNEVIRVNIALKPKDGELLEKTLLEISSPGTESFRKYLKKEQITNMVGRSNEDINLIVNWMNSVGVTRSAISLSPHRDWVHAKLNVGQIEKLFECKLASFENTKTSATKIGARDGIYSIPEEMKDLIEMVSGMTTFSSGHLKVALNSAIEQGDTASVPAEITPATIYENYQSPNTGSHNSKLGSQTVIEFGQFANFNADDTETFFTQLAPSLKGETCEAVYGGNKDDGKPSVEANLDVQYIMAAGTFINTTSYKITGSVGASIEDEFLDYTMLVNSQNEPPLVHSISYGEYGGSYDNATDQRFSYELQKMGISGISVLLASGDNGVGCNTAGTSQEFDYPSSPYITMVGATYIDKSTQEEVGATLSSGGFSKDFYQASWQADAVSAYFQSGATMPSEDFYAMGRAYPDVAAYGQNVQVVASGKIEGVSGTSCSAPIFAGLIALLNDELMQKGEAPLGFLNPWMYANPWMFTDVLTGSNPYERCDGFNAAKGWDPVTGLGTPIYPKMKEAAFASLTA